MSTDIYRGGCCTIEIDTEAQWGPFGKGLAVVTFEDGTTTDARPHLTDAYRDYADKTGYGRSDAACTAYALEHELAHAFVSEHILGLPYSMVQWTQAHHDGNDYPPEAVRYMIGPEERLVRSWQSYANRVQVDSPRLSEWREIITQLFGSLRWWEAIDERQAAA